MRRPKISLKKYFYFTLFFALLLIFALNLREREVWKTKASLLQFSQQQLSTRNYQKNGIGREDDGDDSANIDDENDIEKYSDQEDNNANKKKKKRKSDENTVQRSTTSTAQQHQYQHQHQKQFVQNGENSNAENGGSAEVVQQNANDADANANANANANEPSTSRPWFFKDGEYYPKPYVESLASSSGKKRRGKRRRSKHHGEGAKLFPYQDPHDDRIVNQLMYVPPDYESIKKSGKLKTILLYNGLGPWNIKQGRDVFLRAKCPVDTCEITANRDQANTADMILYKDHFIPTNTRRLANPRQVTMLYHLECPYHTQNVKVPDAINWTSTYRRDSDIVAPYEKWQYYDPKVRQIEQDRNFAANKTKKVAWFVSNCGARNGRLQFAHDLHKYIDVDIYGACGSFKCSRSTADKCFEILDRDYKFYLAFENSNCKDYITEKFFVNALNRNILPIVMGARPEDYEVSAPHRSYIHVDEFASPKELAEYLHILDKDDELYNSYFKWKGTGEFINTYFWCRVCSTLHYDNGLSSRIARWYPDINDWWRGAGVCTNGSWRNFKARKDVIKDDD